MLLLVNFELRAAELEPVNISRLVAAVRIGLENMSEDLRSRSEQ